MDTNQAAGARTPFHRRNPLGIVADTVALMQGFGILPVAERTSAYDFCLCAEQASMIFHDIIGAIAQGTAAAPPPRACRTLAALREAAARKTRQIRSHHAGSAKPHAVERTNSLSLMCSKITLTHFLGLSAFLGTCPTDDLDRAARQLDGLYEDFRRQVSARMSGEDYDVACVALLLLCDEYMDNIDAMMRCVPFNAPEHADRLRRKIELSSISSIVRTIEFSEAHKQAGISILSYFSSVLKQKQPSIIASIKIEQTDRLVRMIIETPEGSKEVVEKTLENYVEVVTEKRQPEDFFENPIHIIELRHKLEIAKLEIRQKEEILRLSEHHRARLEERVALLERSVDEHYRSMGTNLSSVIDLTGRMVSRMDGVAAQKGGASVSHLVDEIKEIVRAGVDHDNINDIKKAILEIKNRDSTVFGHMMDILGKGSVSGAAGNELYRWIEHIRTML